MFKFKLRWDFGGAQNCGRPSLPFYWDLQTPLPKLQHYPSCWFWYYFFYPFLSPPFPSIPFPTDQRHRWYLQCDPGTTRPICAIIDHIMNKTTHHVFSKYAIPTSFRRIWSLLGRRPPTFVCFNDKLCYGFLSFYFYFFHFLLGFYYLVDVELVMQMGVFRVNIIWYCILCWVSFLLWPNCLA